MVSLCIVRCARNDIWHEKTCQTPVSLKYHKYVLCVFLMSPYFSQREISQTALHQMLQRDVQAQGLHYELQWMRFPGTACGPTESRDTSNSSSSGSGNTGGGGPARGLPWRLFLFVCFASKYSASCVRNKRPMRAATCIPSMPTSFLRQTQGFLGQ